MLDSSSALGDAVRKVRKSRQLSQEALAERIGVCKRTIIEIENKSGNPKFEVLCHLVRELDLPLYEVFYPDAKVDLDIRNILEKELDGCTDSEMRIILSVFKCLRSALQEEYKQK